jgi:carbon monoxide dehydrogenase subunit G
MYKFESSVFINRTPQEVFDFISDPANNAKFQSSTESAEWVTEGPPGVGSIFKTKVKFLGRTIEANAQFTGWDPPRMYAVKTISGPIPFESTARLEPQGEGTLLTDTIQAELGGFFKLAEGLVGKQLEKTVDADHSALKLLLEAGQMEPSGEPSMSER